MGSIPIPKSLDKDPSDPSNYRGITLQSVLAKVFEKIILLQLLDSNIHDHIHPLQGGFKPDVSCLHTAFVFLKAVQHLRDQKKKAYMLPFSMCRKLLTLYGTMVSFTSYHGSYGIKDYAWWILRKWYQSTTLASSPGPSPPRRGAWGRGYLLPVQCCGMASNLTPSASNKG